MGRHRGNEDEHTYSLDEDYNRSSNELFCENRQDPASWDDPEIDTEPYRES